MVMVKLSPLAGTVVEAAAVVEPLEMVVLALVAVQVLVELDTQPRFSDISKLVAVVVEVLISSIGLDVMVAAEVAVSYLVPSTAKMNRGGGGGGAYNGAGGHGGDGVVIIKPYEPTTVVNATVEDVQVAPECTCDQVGAARTG